MATSNIALAEKRGSLYAIAFYMALYFCPIAEARFAPPPTIDAGWDRAEKILVGSPIVVKKQFDKVYALYQVRVDIPIRGVKKGQVVQFRDLHNISGEFPKAGVAQLFLIKPKQEGETVPVNLTFLEWNIDTKEAVAFMSHFKAWNRERQDLEIRKLMNRPNHPLESFIHWQSVKRKFPEVLARYEEQFLQGKTEEEKYNSISELRMMDYDENAINQQIIQWLKDDDWESIGEASRRLSPSIKDYRTTLRHALNRSGNYDKVTILGCLVTHGDSKAVDELIAVAQNEALGETVRSNSLHHLNHGYRGDFTDKHLEVFRDLKTSGNRSLVHYGTQLLSKHHRSKLSGP